MSVIELTPDQVCAAHDHLAGRSALLQPVLDSAGPGDVLSVPVTPETVFHIESLTLLAQAHGLGFALQPARDLTPRQMEFIHDFNQFVLKTQPPSEPNPSTVLQDALALAVHGGGAVLRPRRPAPLPGQIPSAVLIGAYGGEHVGDAAILGGVLLGLHRDFGTKRALILSKRPNHTRRLAAALETPVEVSVAPYGHGDLPRAIAGHDGLVFAGGPLMDLPRMLVMHLKAARLAAAAGKPFVVRNVGVGPFKLRASRWVARRIARLASSFTVRTSKAAQDPILAGLDIRIGHDPAFDYLASRNTLTRLTAEEKADTDPLLDGAGGARLIGINIRPIRHDWSDKGTDFARQAEDRFFSECAAGLVALAAQSDRPVRFVFFPMNPIQLGGSDLNAAWRLHTLLAGKVDFRVLEADPDVDGVLYLLRHLDAALTMRFHGSIFSLSQGLGTVGVDYYPGQGGKVEQLFTDQGTPDRVRRMDEVTADWVTGSLAALLAHAPGKAAQ